MSMTDIKSMARNAAMGHPVAMMLSIAFVILSCTIISYLVGSWVYDALAKTINFIYTK